MGIFGFTWADGGAFVGGALGGAFLAAPRAMLGSAVGSFAGATWGDDKGGGAALEEALVAGIGAAGGAWATDLAGVLLRKGVTSAASWTLSAGAAQRVDRVASKVLLPWNSHGGGPVAAFGGAFGGYEVSAQARPAVQIATTDIGNGGCPAQMANLRMPTQRHDGNAAVPAVHRGRCVRPGDWLATERVNAILPALLPGRRHSDHLQRSALDEIQPDPHALAPICSPYSRVSLDEIRDRAASNSG